MTQIHKIQMTRGTDGSFETKVRGNDAAELLALLAAGTASLLLALGKPGKTPDELLGVYVHVLYEAIDGAEYEVAYD